MMIDEFVYESISDMMGRQFIRRGIVKEIDWLGSAAGNVNRIAPAAKVTVLDGENWISHWIPTCSRKHDAGGVEYVPLDERAHVMLLCPGGEPGQMVIAAVIQGMPAEAGETAEERANRRVVKFGGITWIMDRRSGQEQVTLTTPNGHFLVLRDEIHSQGIVIQTGDGHYLAMADLDPESRLTIHHRGGTEIVFDENGDYALTCKRDAAESITRNRSITVGGDETKEVGGDLDYHAASVSIEGDTLARLKSPAEVRLETQGLGLAGIVTGSPDGTFPFDLLTGIPIPASPRCKADV